MRGCQIFNYEVRPFDADTLYEMGCRIRDRRKELGLTMEDVADAIGYDDAKSISKVETGERKCTIERLFMLAQVLQVSVDYLLFGDAFYDRRDDIAKRLEMLDGEHRDWVLHILDLLMVHPVRRL